MGDRLHPQLQQLEGEYQEALERARRLIESLDNRRWEAHPEPGSWSVAECLTHLNLTSQSFLPLIDEGLQQARARGLAGGPPYRRDLFGWLLCRVLEPPYRVRVKTAAAFQPDQIEPMPAVRTTFEQLQAEVLERVRHNSDLDWSRIPVRSPFDSRRSYNLYSCLKIIVAHQRRHLWQAERIVARLSKVPA